MKLKNPLSFLLGGPFIALLAAPRLQAQTTYYWDNNGTAGGFGTAVGTWADPTVNQWSTSSAGTATPGASITTATNDTLHFGNGTNGLADGTITVSGTVNSGNMNFAAGSATTPTTPAGAITLTGGKINFASAATITFNKVSDNATSPSTPSNLTGDVNISSEISGSGNLSFLHAGNFRGTFTTTLGVISNTGNVTFGHAASTTNNPSANFIFSGASTYTGSTNFSVFTNNSVRLQLGIANGLSTASVLNFGTIAGTASGRESNLNLNGFNQTLAGVSGTSTGTRVMRIQNTSATAATLTINGSSSNTFSGMLGSNGLGGAFSLSNGNNFSVVKDGSGTWTLDAQVTGAATNSAAAPNTYTGLTTINGGAIRVQYAGALGSTAAGTVVNGTNENTSANARLELAGGITVTGEALTISGSGNFSGALTSTSGDNVWAGDVTIGAAGTRIGAVANSSLEISGTIDSGVVNTGLNIRTANVTDSSVILSGVNTYLGNTQVLIGKLKLAGGDDRLPVGTNLILSSGGTNVAEFDLNGRNQQVAGLLLSANADATQNSVNNSSGTLSTLTVNTAASPSTYAGRLDGNLALTKTGANTLTLTGTNNTYTGATNVNQGTLIVDGNTGTSSAVNVAAGVAADATLATLGGTGIIGGNVSLAAESAAGFKNGGVLAPNAEESGTKLSVTGTTTFNTGSIFEWNMSATTPASDPGIGATNSGSYGQLAGTGAVSGSNAVFKIVLGAGNAFTDAFWNTDKEWNNLFTGAGSTNTLASMFSSISGAGITFESNMGTVADRGYFTVNGTSTLNWTAVPEPTSALAGLLLTAGLLRRRR